MNTRELAYEFIDLPNSETLEAFDELDNGGGFVFRGTTEQFFNELVEASIGECERLIADPKVKRYSAEEAIKELKL